MYTPIIDAFWRSSDLKPIDSSYSWSTLELKLKIVKRYHVDNQNYQNIQKIRPWILPECNGKKCHQIWFNPSKSPNMGIQPRPEPSWLCSTNLEYHIEFRFLPNPQYPVLPSLVSAWWRLAIAFGSPNVVFQVIKIPSSEIQVWWFRFTCIRVPKLKRIQEIRVDGDWHSPWIEPCFHNWLDEGL